MDFVVLPGGKQVIYNWWFCIARVYLFPGLKYCTGLLATYIVFSFFGQVIVRAFQKEAYVAS